MYIFIYIHLYTYTRVYTTAVAMNRSREESLHRLIKSPWSTTIQTTTNPWQKRSWLQSGCATVATVTMTNRCASKQSARSLPRSLPTTRPKMSCPQRKQRFIIGRVYMDFVASDWHRQNSYIYIYMYKCIYIYLYVK